MQNYPDLEIDWIKIFSDFKEALFENEKIDSVLYFVSWHRQKDPNDYLERYEFIERDLCNYFLYKNDIERLKERIGIIQQNPVSAIETLTIRLVFQLIYHGHYDLAVSYAEAVWKPIDESDKLIGFPAFTFINTIFAHYLQRFYESRLNDSDLDENELFKKIVSLGFNQDETIFNEIMLALREDLVKEKVEENINKGKDNHLLSLKIHFLKHMFHTYQLPFVFSQWIWNFTSTKELFGKQKGVENWFYIDAKTLDKHILDDLDNLFGSNQLEIFGKVWGLDFVFDFFHQQQLLSSGHHEQMMENINHFRAEMMRTANSDLWQMTFVFNWPKTNNSVVDPSDRDLFDGTFGNSVLEAEEKINAHLSNYQTPERITKELKQKDSRENNPFSMWGTTKPIVREEPKVGRNDLCPCGSGKKFKKCCMDK